jgi:hypothetical protein
MSATGNASPATSSGSISLVLRTEPLSQEWR